MNHLVDVNESFLRKIAETVTGIHHSIFGCIKKYNYYILNSCFRGKFAQVIIDINTVGINISYYSSHDFYHAFFKKEIDIEVKTKVLKYLSNNNYDITYIKFN
jgi:hypothetical protein